MRDCQAADAARRDLALGLPHALPLTAKSAAAKAATKLRYMRFAPPNSLIDKGIDPLKPDQRPPDTLPLDAASRAIVTRARAVTFDAAREY